ncbi:5-oxoprolinase subunit PxpB [Bacillus sp. CGMCC 1.16607]|uniref:5-oxoprolinase subunit PxpB n=1 Tax=Bacillus sp. CGMCC 1.16607 TaxID=3351842 RepID=UPI0036365FE5
MVFPLSEDSIIIQFGTKNQNLKAQIHDVQKAMNKIQSKPFLGFRELVPAYNTLTIYYDPYVMNDYSPYEIVKKQIEQILHTHDQISYVKKRYFELPVCYEAKFAPDLEELAISKGLTSEEMIQMHTTMIYDVVFIGFSPGFPFLTGLDEKLHFPRKTSPRLQVEQGSVGIAGNQTGIYPITSPGGWQIIGRTPVRLFNVQHHPPTLIKAGDQIKFYPISQKEFTQWEDTLWE